MIGKHIILWDAIFQIYIFNIQWAKVNSLCDMTIFIHAASKKLCAMSAKWSILLATCLNSLLL